MRRKNMKHGTKKLVVLLVVASFVFGITGNSQVSSAKEIFYAYSVDSKNMDYVNIKNDNKNNAVTVTYSAYPYNASDVAKVEIFKVDNYTGTPYQVKTFNSRQQYTATFSLPKNTTYYARISSASGGSFRGEFVATY